MLCYAILYYTTTTAATTTTTVTTTTTITVTTTTTTTAAAATTTTTIITITIIAIDMIHTSITFPGSVHKTNKRDAQRSEGGGLYTFRKTVLYTTTTQRGWYIEAFVSILVQSQSRTSLPGGGGV